MFSHDTNPPHCANASNSANRGDSGAGERSSGGSTTSTKKKSAPSFLTIQSLDAASRGRGSSMGGHHHHHNDMNGMPSENDLSSPMASATTSFFEAAQAQANGVLNSHSHSVSSHHSTSSGSYNTRTSPTSAALNLISSLHQISSTSGIEDTSTDSLLKSILASHTSSVLQSVQEQVSDVSPSRRNKRRQFSSSEESGRPSSPPGSMRLTTIRRDHMIVEDDHPPTHHHGDQNPRHPSAQIQFSDHSLSSFGSLSSSPHSLDAAVSRHQHKSTFPDQHVDLSVTSSKKIAKRSADGAMLSSESHTTSTSVPINFASRHQNLSTANESPIMEQHASDNNFNVTHQNVNLLPAQDKTRNDVKEFLSAGNVRATLGSELSEAHAASIRYTTTTTTTLLHEELSPHKEQHVLRYSSSDASSSLQQQTNVVMERTLPIGHTNAAGEHDGVILTAVASSAAVEVKSSSKKRKRQEWEQQGRDQSADDRPTLQPRSSQRVVSPPQIVPAKVTMFPSTIVAPASRSPPNSTPYTPRPHTIKNIYSHEVCKSKEGKSRGDADRKVNPLMKGKLLFLQQQEQNSSLNETMSADAEEALLKSATTNTSGRRSKLRMLGAPKRAASAKQTSNSAISNTQRSSSKSDSASNKSSSSSSDSTNNTSRRTPFGTGDEHNDDSDDAPQFKVPRFPPIHHSALNAQPVLLYIPKRELFHLLVKTPLPHTPRMLPFTQLLTLYITQGLIPTSNLKIKSYSIHSDATREMRKYHDSKYLNYLKKQSLREYKLMEMKNAILKSEDSIYQSNTGGTHHRSRSPSDNQDDHYVWSSTFSGHTSGNHMSSVTNDSVKQQLKRQLVNDATIDPELIEEIFSDEEADFSDDDSDDSDNSDEEDSSSDDDSMGIAAKLPSYGIDTDAPMFPLLWPHIKLITSGTLKATRDLLTKDHRIGIHFPGGRHHARKDRAAGYCYVNDIVLGALLFAKNRKKVMIIDIDIHHGDGTEKAFYFSNNVMPISFHQYGKGLYPGTGNVDEIGEGKGLGFNVNVPLMDGISDANFCELFRVVITRAVEYFMPDVIIFVCGADALSRDQLGVGNLTTRAYESCSLLLVEMLKRYNHMKLLVTGAGGYNLADTIRVWEVVTAALATGQSSSLPEPVPDDFVNYQIFQPDFMLHTTAEKVRDRNTCTYLTEIRTKILSNLSS
mmetsp:Transcript_11367/g.42648  ORF Transcript_11367/g.42648 Transcript_11367/m.42648 type:complete len:1183 (-) Transcript_11367:87-3635(-)|eukprot:CAMPEP_0117444946 /NCGR_PEP_ID=MMETSP0759-20121206/5526_1 /TAXON_ID=63605 /ORGANISM="Percolomonas cosmopolitus, Strain WS" /LENGTH=1182 /DNA_ID=CAMNT_0005237075 /DNA_START=424 /DNA_END=3972 /DNA_ORIENTATION=+